VFVWALILSYFLVPRMYQHRVLFWGIFGALILRAIFIFAVDSVPAVLAVSHEQFIVFASNAFAILGLRSMYFLLGGMAGRFRYLNVGLGLILAFVGVKMLLSDVWHPPSWLSLVVILLTLAASVVASTIADRREASRPN